MITAQWTATHGWAAPCLVPYGPLTLMPTASCLHYATTCFEGLKLYRGNDGHLRLFRPGLNAARMLHSATAIALPAFLPAELVLLIKKLCAVDGPRWLPKERPGHFLYLRPTILGTMAAIGVARPKEALLNIIACYLPSRDTGVARPAPVANNSSNDSTAEKSPPCAGAMRLWASRGDECRAWPGGFGHAKVGANYGPTLAAGDAAKARGYDQVLWLFGPEARVTEAGASNFFVVWDIEGKEGEMHRELVTAPLTDRIILDGVTRRSVIELARERLDGEVEVVERKFTMEEVRRAVMEGRLVEAFATGTFVSQTSSKGGCPTDFAQAFISPVSEIHYRGTDLPIPLSKGTTGKYADLFKTWLKDIMYGSEEHPWAVIVDEE